MIHLTFERALFELGAAVNQRGEGFVYPDDWKTDDDLCQYVIDGHPACIVGVVLDRIGADVGQLEGRYAEPRTAALYCDVQMDDDAANLLWFAQDAQDKGFTWGQAYTYAATEISRPPFVLEEVPC